MPDTLNEGPDYDDDGMPYPYLDMDSIDRNGNRHPDYERYQKETSRQYESGEEARESSYSALLPERRWVGVDKVIVQRSFQPINRRDFARQSDDADYAPTDEDMEDQR